VKNSLVLSGVDVITYGRLFDTQESDACESFEHKGDESSILKDSESSIEGDAWQRYFVLLSFLLLRFGGIFVTIASQ
jgi:hypothetical protein